MPGVGHGGPRKGTMSFDRKLNSEAARHAVLLETHIPDPTVSELSALRAIIARNARDDAEREMFDSMLLGERVEIPKCQKCGTVWVVKSLADDCEARNCDAGEGDEDE